MGLKSFLNTRNGRAGTFVVFLGLIAVAIAGGTIWYFLYLPQLNSNNAQAALLERTGGEFVEASVGPEENQLPGLPSTTLTIQDTYNEEEPRNAFIYAQEVLEKSELDALVNTHIFRGESDDESGLLYDFLFYSSSLSDYDEDSVYDENTSSFAALLDSGFSELNYHSKPLSTGGRDISISAKSSESFGGNVSYQFSNSWRDLVNSVSSKVKADTGQRVTLNLTDSSDSITITAVLASEADVEAASALGERMWSTFDAYISSSQFNYLDIRHLNYSIERTSEDSVLTLTTGIDSMTADRVMETARNIPNGIAVPGSYITYFKTADSEVPYLTIDSSSRNW